MSTLGWIALVLAVLVAAVVLLVLGHRSRRSAVGSPRTVADLVRLRAEQADTAEAAPDAVVPEPEPVEAPAEPPAAARPDETHAAEAVAAKATEPLPAGPPAATIGLPVADTPWNRAAHIAESAGVVWAAAPDSDHDDHDWSGWADWADTDADEADGSGAHAVPDRPGPALRPVVLPALPPHLVDTRSAAPAPVPGPAAVPDPVAAPSGTEPPTLEPTRRTPAETAAEQAAADLALLRTFGCTRPSGQDDDEPSTVSLEGAGHVAAEPSPGADQPVAFRVVGRDGAGVADAGVTLLDDRGQEAAGAVTDAAGRATVRAPHPGSYVLVSAAAGHQPGAVAITVAGEPVEADLLLARSASVAGTVFGEDGPVVGARLLLVQDGEIVDSAESGPGGEYRIADLAAGEYGLSVTASECEPAAVLVTVPDETELHHDIDLDPVGLTVETGPADDPANDVMIGHR